MATLTRLAIVTPGAVKFEGDAEIVVAPGAAGDLGALAKHAPLLTTLRTGVVRATVADTSPDAKAATRRVEFAVDRGFAQILADKVIILTDVALSREEVNVDEARSDLRRAEEKLAQKRGGDDSAERQAIAWAQTRLDVARRPA